MLGTAVIAAGITSFGDAMNGRWRPLVPAWRLIPSTPPVLFWDNPPLFMHATTPHKFAPWHGQPPWQATNNRDISLERKKKQPALNLRQVLHTCYMGLLYIPQSFNAYTAFSKDLSLHGCIPCNKCRIFLHLVCTIWQAIGSLFSRRKCTFQSFEVQESRISSMKRPAVRDAPGMLMLYQIFFFSITDSFHDLCFQISHHPRFTYCRHIPPRICVLATSAEREMNFGICLLPYLCTHAHTRKRKHNNDNHLRMHVRKRNTSTETVHELSTSHPKIPRYDHHSSIHSVKKNKRTGVKMHTLLLKQGIFNDWHQYSQA